MFRSKSDWKRVSNCPGGVGTRPTNKYNFSTYLKKTGDFIETYPMSKQEVDKVFYAAHIWSWRKHCRIKTSRSYHAEDKLSLMIEVISNTRKERK